MPITRDAIEKRLAILREQLKQLESNGNALIGAINDCEYWLRQWDSGEASAAAIPNPETASEVTHV